MNRRRGFTLIDVLLALSLMGVFSLMAYRLVRGSMHITAASLVADDNTARFDNALQMLREDVLHSISFEMPAKNRLSIHIPDHQLIQWHQEHNSLCRSQGNDNRNWDIGQPVEIKLDGQIVVVSPSPSDQIAMTALPAKGNR